MRNIQLIYFHLRIHYYKTHVNMSLILAALRQLLAVVITIHTYTDFFIVSIPFRSFEWLAQMQPTAILFIKLTAPESDNQRKTQKMNVKPIAHR